MFKNLFSSRHKPKWDGNIVPEYILEQQCQELQALFPQVSNNELSSALRIHKTVSSAAGATADVLPEDDNTTYSDENILNKGQESASEILTRLKEKMLGTTKLKVDQEDLLSHILQGPLF